MKIAGRYRYALKICVSSWVGKLTFKQFNDYCVAQ